MFKKRKDLVELLWLFKVEHLISWDISFYGNEITVGQLMNLLT